MAAAFSSITSLAYAARTNSTLNKPTVSVGDEMLAVIISTGSSAPAVDTVTAPTGFTGYTGITTTTFNAFGLFMRAILYTRSVDGSEGASFTWTHASRSTAGAILGLTGVDSTTPINTLSQSNGTGSTATYPTVTPPAGGALVDIGLDFGDFANNLSPPSGTPTLIERLDSVVLYISTADNVAASATGARTQTNNNNPANSPWWASQVVINPGAGVAAGPVKKLIIFNRQALIRAAYW